MGPPSSRSWYPPRKWAQGGPYDSDLGKLMWESVIVNLGYRPNSTKGKNFYRLPFTPPSLVARIGPSQVPRTVRKGHADSPARCRGQSVKANRTTRDAPRKIDRPRRPGGPSARVPDRPLLKLGPSANQLQQKPKTKMDRKRRRARTRRTHEEHGARRRSARSTRTVRASRTEAKTARPLRSTPPTHHRISQTVEAVETRVWEYDMRQPRMLYPKKFSS
jgi:hypothetical protein